MLKGLKKKSFGPLNLLGRPCFKGNTFCIKQIKLH